MKWRALLLLPAFPLVTAATPSAPVSVGQLSEAVATVNDWRALGIFLFAFIIIREAATGWQRLQDRKASDRLAGAIDRMADQLAASEQANLIHRAKVEAMAGRLQ